MGWWSSCSAICATCGPIRACNTKACPDECAYRGSTFLSCGCARRCFTACGFRFGFAVAPDLAALQAGPARLLEPGHFHGAVRAEPAGRSDLERQAADCALQRPIDVSDCDHLFGKGVRRRFRFAG